MEVTGLWRLYRNYLVNSKIVKTKGLLKMKVRNTVPFLGKSQVNVCHIYIFFFNDFLNTREDIVVELGSFDNQS